MKFRRRILSGILALTLCSTMLTSCYTYTTAVGGGAQGNQETEKWNHYFIYGLAPGDISNPKELAGGATSYTVETRISFVNGLISGLTFGIYTPSTTKIIK